MIFQLPANLRSTYTSEGEGGIDGETELISQRISQVAENLVENAFLFNKAEGMVEVTTSIQEHGELQSSIRRFQL